MITLYPSATPHFKGFYEYEIIHKLPWLKRLVGFVRSKGRTGHSFRDLPVSCPLSSGRALREELRDRIHQLSDSKRLLQKDTVEDTLRGPFIACTRGYVDHGKIRVDLPRLANCFPATHAPVSG